MEATNNLLAPYGLTADSFLQKQRSLSEQFVKYLISEIEEARLRIGDDVIFCGLDDTGPHIFVSNGSDLTTADSMGFAAIGSGSEHAESQFMLAEHTRNESLEDTVLLSYIAKKRSEVSPGVGKQTDMFVIPPAGRYFLNHENITRLNEIYDRMEAAQFEALKRAKVEATAYVAELREKAKLAEQTQTQLPEVKPTKASETT